MAEKDLLIQTEKWSNIEENNQQQKSRAMWIKLGDSNTKYFTVVMNERRYKKQIVELTSANGEKLVEVAAIQKETITFYQSLMGTAFQSTIAVNKNITKKVKEFLLTRKLHKALNCTSVTLLSKVPNPTSIKEYRPITCCIVLYKLIAKVLANRIDQVCKTTYQKVLYSLEESRMM
ncbi:uncharacterized protein LOC129894027 [Solanum dulcamara]|uniref:uncharacterized protein LOC129894027 n=1 Tax=Solanum dulcamara TaxID=45834 RepID=UPI0024869E40|nr:uncharacterized protein LOC129894027 [Solanum dulcamara]